MRRICGFALFFLLTLATAAPAISASIRSSDFTHPWDNKRVYYLIEYQGQLREKGFFVRRPGTYHKAPCVIYDEEKTSHAQLNGLPIVRTFLTKTITSPEGAALYRQEEAVYGDSGQETVVIEDGAATITASGYFGQSTTIPVPPGVLFEISGEWLARQLPGSGKTISVDILDRERREVTRESIRIGEQIEGYGAAGEPAIWAAEFLSEGMPPMAAMFTSDGRLLRIESEGLVYQVVSRDEYAAERMNPRQPYVFSADRQEALARRGVSRQGATMALPAIAIGAVIPAWDNFTWLVLQAGPAGQWFSHLQPSEYAQIENPEGFAAITALRNAPRVDVGATLPMATLPELQPYLASVAKAPSQNAAIIQAARAAVTDSETRQPETNVLRAVSFLAGWINQEIALAPDLIFDDDAVSALTARQGDSLGHALLFTAMARSLGIPTRVCQGLLVQAGQAVYHAWAEAWINGVWVPVDTTVSRVGLPAGYILAERSGPDCVLSPDFAAFLLDPVLALHMVSAGRETPLGALAELTVGDRRTYAAYEGDWLANLYWGFALRLPSGWNGRAKLNSVEIASPDRMANIKCEALDGNYQAGQAELDSNVANLRDNLEQFRLVDSRLVSFDPEGATPALFIDFVCVQNGVQLRCRQYVLPRRQRAFRISFWAPAANYNVYTPYFDSILTSFEY